MALFSVALVLAPHAFGATSAIAIDSFLIEPTELVLGEAFTVRAAVKATGIPNLSAVLRTAEPLPREAAPPAFTEYREDRRLACMADAGDVNLADNGPLDQDPVKGAFALSVSTAGWKPGRYLIGFFAHNRPAPGPHIVDHRHFTVTVEENRARVEYAERPPLPRLERCAFVPTDVAPGQTTRLEMVTASEDLACATVRHQYYVAEDRVPPSLVYDATARIAWLGDPGKAHIANGGPLDAAADRKTIAVPIDTVGWRPGLYHFEVVVENAAGLESVGRPILLKIAAPQDSLDVSVSESWEVCEGTHAERLVPISNGRLLYTEYLSDDRGASWTRRDSGTIGPGALQLRDGRVLGFAYRTLPIEHRQGWYRGERYLSEDNGQTVAISEAAFHVPQAKPAMGHAYHPGPLFMRSLVERADGSLVALMAGWFQGDDAPCPYSPERPYSRTYACESADGGLTWKFLSTLGYDAIGSEGYNEGSLKALPNGDLIAVLRTGSMSNIQCQDNPIMVTRSRDGGRSWEAPWRTGLNGAFPDLIVLSDGRLALSYGRPGANIAFSDDEGRTWTDLHGVDANPYSGYSTISETAPGEILMLFGVRNWRDAAPDSEPRSSIRAARIRYTPRHVATIRDARARFEHYGVHIEERPEGYWECTVASRSLGRDESFALRLPGNYRQDRPEPYGLVVFLHGLGRDHRTLFEMPATCAALDNVPCVFLSPNGRDSWWIDSPSRPQSKYQSYLVELIRLIDGTLHVSQDPAHRAIGGWSMGGFGSMHYLLRYPGQFGAWAGILALLDFPNDAYPPERNHTVPNLLGPKEQWRTLNPISRVEQLMGKRLFFVTATDAFDRDMNEAFSVKLDELGIPHTAKVVDGAHTFAVVAATFPEVIEFLGLSAQAEE